MDDLLARLKAANADVERRDRRLREELTERRETASFMQESARESRGTRDSPASPSPAALAFARAQRVDPQDFVAETIVRRTGRPVLAIVRDQAQIVFTDPESQVWGERLRNASTHLVNAAKAVGRIEVVGHDLDWLGTGWMISPDVIVTNRHVAQEFGRRRGSGAGASFVFKQSLLGLGAMSASIDFLEEIGRPDSLTFRLERILHINDEDEADVAFLQVTPLSGLTLAAPIPLATGAVDEEEMIAVIGYPARDSRLPDQPLMDQIFGNVFDKKRLAPGQITRADAQTLRHDCSTLGGNSGSVVLSLRTGEAIGLHFAGRFLEANFAVPSTVVAELLDSVSRGGSSRRPTPVSPVLPDETPTSTAATPATIAAAPQTASPQTVAPQTTGGKISYVFPVRVTIEMGEPYADAVAAGAATVTVTAADAGAGATSSGNGHNATAPSARRRPAITDDDEMDDVFAEARVEDYRDREGYLNSFLGDRAEVPLPRLTRHQSDILSFDLEGQRENVLKYEHFSVVMSKARRLCRFSAVNIDGQNSRRLARVDWRMDPRIPSSAQIRRECYGNPPKFARGHMTRREDPIWGAVKAATLGNSDSMHVTNAVPQMQPFNGGIWLELEDYALQHARQDDMKISVFTGPFLTDDDPVMFDVQIPIEFWKVIAFIHDETGELCATGYTMSQEDFLSEDEFVFGKHKTTQRSIAEIERRAGLSFGPLAAVDPFETVEGVAPRLTSLRQIQFLRRR